MVLEDTADVYFAYCNALQVFQGRWHPEMSWTVLRLARLTNLQQPELRCRNSRWCDKPAVLRYIYLRHDFAASLWSHLIFWFHAICMTANYFACFLVTLSVAYGGGVPRAELDHWQGCAFPYEIRGPALFVLWWRYGCFSLACESSCAPLPYAPPAGGVLGTMTAATFLPTENGRLRSLTLRPSAQAHLRGRWERQVYRSVIMYSPLHLCQWRRAWCFDFHVPLNVVVDNSFLACFWARRSGQTAVSRGKSFLWVFWFGLLPLSCVWFAVFLDETQIWLGDLLVVWLFVWFSVCCDLPSSPDL